MCVGPKLEDEAEGGEAEAARRHCKPGKLRKRKRSGAKAWRVVNQHPRPHAKRAAGAKVNRTLG